MVIYIAADHRGYELKESLKKFLVEKGYTVVDTGNDHYDENDDYPDFARKVAEKVSMNYETSVGILICGSGVGVDVVANKYKNVRSALANSPDQAFDSRHDDNANVLSLGANYLNEETARQIVTTWLTTPFGGDARYLRRLEKIAQLERELNPSSEEEERS